MNYLCWGLSIAKFKTQNRFLFTVWHTSAQALSSLVGLYTRHELNFHYDLTPSEIIGTPSLLCLSVSTWGLRLSLPSSRGDGRVIWCVHLREGTEDACLAPNTSLKRHGCPQSHDLGSALISSGSCLPRDRCQVFLPSTHNWVWNCLIWDECSEVLWPHI